MKYRFCVPSLSEHNDLIKKEDSIAYCYLSIPQNERHLVMVTEKEVILRLKNHDKVFPLEQIRALETGRKVILFPAVIGGIACPLFLVGAFNGLGNLWLMMSLAFAGLLALYYGLSGTDTLILQTKVKDFHFFIDNQHPQLAVFCSFYNRVLSKGRLDKYFCLNLNEDEISQLKNTGYLGTPEEGRPLTGMDEIPRGSADTWFILAAPVQNGYRIGYTQKDPDHIQAMVFSNLKAEHLIPLAVDKR